MVAWRALAARAAATARGRPVGRPGPVHLNVQFEEPLTPESSDGWGSALDGRIEQQPWMLPGKPLRAQPEDLADGPRTVVVAGEDAGPPARMLAEQTGWPLLAEPTSGSRTGEAVIRTYRLLLGDDELSGRVQRVVVYGHPTLSRPVTRLLARDDVEVVAVTGASGWSDPGTSPGPAGSWTRVVAPPTASMDAWGEEWRRRDADLSRRLDAQPGGPGCLTPQQVAGAVSEALPPGGLLFVGASNPVRDLDLMVRAVPRRRPPHGDRQPRPRRDRRVGLQRSGSRARATAQHPVPGPARRRHLPARQQRPGPRSGRAATRPDDRGRQRRRRIDLRLPRAWLGAACRVLRPALRHPARSRPGRPVLGHPHPALEGRLGAGAAARAGRPGRRRSRSSRRSSAATTDASSTARSGIWWRGLDPDRPGDLAGRVGRPRPRRGTHGLPGRASPDTTSAQAPATAWPSTGSGTAECSGPVLVE